MPEEECGFYFLLNFQLFLQLNKFCYMKIIIRGVFLLFLIFSGIASGQKYGNIWQFGDHAGMDFKSCDPLVIMNGVNTGFEGTSCISDSGGTLLFYTNSDTVWNKTNQSMSNGYLIPSSGTISQVLIISKPQSGTTYYIITSKIQASGSLTLQYHVVDMSLMSGLGAVTSKNNVITTANVTEQISATHHQNGVDIWLMVHEYGTNSFFAYLITAAGISATPVISSIGPAHVPCTSNINARGEIKFSPNGNKMAFNANGIGGNDATNILCLFDFDQSTGVVSHPINLPFCRGDFGLSFSPDNSKLYGSTWKAFSFGAGDYNYIYQFDLSSGDSTLIVNSRQIIDSALQPATFGSLKLAPNGKIYSARNGSHYLGVISQPNLVGAACDYITNGFYLGGKTCRFGLNNYIEYTQYCLVTGLVEPDVVHSQISIYPNPFSEETIIKFENPEAENYSLYIYDPEGKLVRSYTDSYVDQILVKRDKLTAGIYFVQLRSMAKSTISGKLIVY